MSLIPEKPLLVYPQLATALGLEGAVLIQALKELIELGSSEVHNGFLWIDIASEKLIKLLPFWSEADIQRISQQLHEQGILLIGGTAFRRGQTFRVAINERLESAPAQASTRNPTPTPPATPATYQHQQPTRAHPQADHFNSARTIPSAWQPDADLLAQLAQYGIPRSFALEQIGEFVTYWSERNEPKHSWAAKYLKHVLRLWREQQSTQARQSQEISIASDWQPSPEAMEILTMQAEINLNFVEDAIAEFVLYWQERGITSSTWNSRFIQHVKRQWARFTHTLKADMDPYPINNDWRPDAAVFDILAMANIDKQFAEELVPEFILYWQDSGQALNSWNTKFLQYAKRQWAYLSNKSQQGSDLNKTNNPHETQQRSRRQGSTRSRDLAEELSDRSWAN